MWEMLLTFLSRIALEPAAVVVELLLIGLCVNWLASVLQGTRGTRPLRGVLVILVVATVIVRIFVDQFGWARLELVYNYVLAGLVLIALVVFQPEFRRAIIRVGDVRFPRSRETTSQLVNALVKTAAYLSKNKYGGLIAIQRDVDLTGWAENGTMVQADVSSNLLNTIFYPGSALHDLGVIIRGNRVVAANCQFPTAASDEIDMAVGSRHLAALGMSYETDALVLVVSEETGVISLADAGRLTRYLSLDDLATELETRLTRGSPRFGASARSARIWAALQRVLIVVPLTAMIWYLTDQATLTNTTVNLELSVQHPSPDAIVDILEPRPARADAARRNPDALNAELIRLQATFEGSANQIDRLRRATADRPLRLRWTLATTDATVGEHQLPAAELKSRLDALSEVSSRGLSVRSQALVDLRYRVDERVTVSLDIRPDAGATRIVVDGVEPPKATAVFRMKDLADFLGRRPTPANLEQFAAERAVRAPLGEAVSDWEPEVQRTVDAVLDEQIGTLRAVSISPNRAEITARVIGQRRKIENIVVGLFIAPGIEATYDVTRLDANEWRIDVEVTGRESVLDDLGPADMQAFVRVTPDMLPPIDAPASEQLRLVPITILAPPGVTVAAGPQKTARLRLVPRGGSTS